MRSNPNARRQMGVRMEAAPLPPNHGGDGFLTKARQVTSLAVDRIGGLGLRDCHTSPGTKSPYAERPY
jgi:hypothetical protein